MFVSVSLCPFCLGIKVRTFLSCTRAGHDHSVFTFYSRCLGSREITKTKVHNFFLNTLYIGLGDWGTQGAIFWHPYFDPTNMLTLRGCTTEVDLEFVLIVASFYNKTWAEL